MTTSEPTPGRRRATARRDRGGRDALPGRSAGVVLGLCVALGLVMGAVWSAVATPVHATVSEGRVITDEVASAAWFAIDGWFGLLGGVAGLLVGGVSFILLRARPVPLVLVNVVGGLLGSVVAWRLGRLLGPQLPAQRPADGSRLALPLDLQAYGVLLIWPMAALTIILLINVFRDERH